MLQGCGALCRPGDHARGCPREGAPAEIELAEVAVAEKSAWKWWLAAQEHRRKLQELMLKRRLSPTPTVLPEQS